jgi:sugar lactone lactonase YvrE
MHHIKKIFFGFILLGSTATAVPLGNTLFTITPSITSLYLSSNGAGNVMYTVTNNSTTGATPAITPGYQSSGNNLTIGSNTCNVSLSPGASCTFRVLISGANQPASFTITPRACGFNGFICSVASSAVTVTVTQPATGLPSRAYEEVINADDSTTTLLGININNTSDVLSANLNFTSVINSVVISPDGSKVYATENDTGGETAVAFFDVSSDNMVLNRVVLIPEFSLRNSPASSMQMAITPDGSTLFITRYTGVGLQSAKNIFVPAASFFRIDLTSDASVATVIADPDHILTSPRGLVVSPDSKTVYVGTDTDYIVALPVNAVSVNSSNKIAQGQIPANEHFGLAIDSAGNKLYVGNYADGSVSVLTVNGMQVDSVETILDGEGYVGASGLAVSPDGATLYVAENGSQGVVAVSVNNSSGLVQPGINGAFGLGLSSDGKTLYVSQMEDGLQITTVINASNFLATPTTVDIGGVSFTIGQFVGP